MSVKTKIVVIRAKELILAGILAAAGLFFIILLALLFLPGKEKHDSPPAEAPSETEAPASPGPSPATDNSDLFQNSAQGQILQENVRAVSYTPGVYKTELLLGGQTLEVEAVLEKDSIASLRLVNLDEAVTTMYPLLQPTMEHICQQVYETQSLQSITYDPGAKYTSMVLLEAIRSCLEKGSSTVLPGQPSK